MAYSDVIGELVTMFTSDLTGLISGIDKSKNMISSAADSFSNMGRNLTYGVTMPIIGFGVAAVKAAADSELVVTKLDLAIKNAGKSANTTSKQAIDLSKSLELMSGVDDEAIMGAETITAGFKQIGKEIFPEVTKAALDMSAAMGTDVTSATRSLDLALAAPETGLRRLRAQQIIFTAEQQKHIKELVKSGHALEAQKIILAAVEAKYKGAAKAIGDTTAGAMKKFGNAMGDLSEAIGGQLLPIITPLISKITEFVVGLGNLDPHIIQIGLAIAGVIAVIGPLMSLIGIIGGALALLASPIGLIIAAVVALGVAFATNFMGIRDIVMNVVKFFEPVWNRIKESIGWFIDDIKHFGLVDAILGAFGFGKSGAAAGGQSWIEGIIRTLIETVRNAIPTVVGAIKSLWHEIDYWIQFTGVPLLLKSWNALFDGISSWVSTTAWPTIQNAVMSFFDSIGEWFSGGGATKLAIDFGSAVVQLATWLHDHGWETLQEAVGNLFASISNFFSGEGALELVKGIGLAVIDVAKWVIQVGIPIAMNAFNQLIGEILKILGKITEGIISSVRQGIAGAQEIASGGNIGGGVKSIAQNPILGGGLSEVLGFFGFHDYEGPGAAGKPQLIGTGAQPELFIPQSSGNFFPVGAYNTSGGGGGYNGPKTLRVELHAGKLLDYIDIELEQAIQEGRQASAS